MIYWKAVHNAWVLQSRQSSQRDGKGLDDANAAEHAKKRTLDREGGVGDEVQGTGIGLGIAPKESKPVNKLDRGAEKSPDQKQLADQLA